MDRKTIRLKDGMVALIRDDGECSKVGEAIDRLADLEDKLERGEMVEVGTRRIYTEAGNGVFMVYDGEVIQLIQCGAMIDAKGDVFVTLAYDDKIFPYREGDAEHDTEPADWCKDFIELSPDEYIKTVFATEEEARAALPVEAI